MVQSPAFPLSSRAFDARPPRHATRTTLIIAGSVAVHAAVAAYLAVVQFSPPVQALPTPDLPPIVIQTYKAPPPPPPQAPEPVERPRIRIHTPTVVTTVPIPPLPVEPLPDLPQVPGPVASLTIPDPKPPAPDPVIRDPTWLKMPGAAEFARFYPDAAIRREIEGRAVIGCRVTARGTVESCRVVSETPADARFGEAAIKLARYFAMSPKTVDGRPVEGGQVNIPIAFRLAK